MKLYVAHMKSDILLISGLSNEIFLAEVIGYYNWVGFNGEPYEKTKLDVNCFRHNFDVFGASGSSN